MQYRKVGDMVELRGVIRGGTAGTVAFTLPAGFRPPAHIEAALYYFTGSAAALSNFQINFDGTVTMGPTVTAAGAAAFILEQFSTTV
jgi:hypothetical protein